MRSTTRSAEAAALPGSRTPFAGALSWVLLVGGIVGITASFVLTVEKFELATDPAYVPSCSINPILNCGSVMSTPQASAFGFPNSLLGIAGFAAVAAVGAALVGGVVLPRWYWWGLQAGVSAAVIFVHWLIVQSLYTIGTLCPYCMVVWAVTVPMFWYVTLANLTRFGPARRPRVVTVLVRNHAVVPTVWALTVAALIARRFWWYWSGLL